jgi:hypothetical protein
MNRFTFVVICIGCMSFGCEEENGSVSSRLSPDECMQVDSLGWIHSPMILGQWGFNPRNWGVCLAWDFDTIYAHKSVDLDSGEDVWAGGFIINNLCEDYSIENIQLESSLVLANSVEARSGGGAHVEFNSMYSTSLIGHFVNIDASVNEANEQFEFILGFNDDAIGNPVIPSALAFPNPVDREATLQITYAIPRQSVVSIILVDIAIDTVYHNLAEEAGAHLVPVSLVDISSNKARIDVVVGEETMSGFVCVK